MEQTIFVRITCWKYEEKSLFGFKRYWPGQQTVAYVHAGMEACTHISVDCDWAKQEYSLLTVCGSSGRNLPPVAYSNLNCLYCKGCKTVTELIGAN